MARNDWIPERAPTNECDCLPGRSCPHPPQRVDVVNHPAHYTGHPSGVECIQITEHMNFNLGNVIKYVWRAFDKGATIQDLEKAKWYLSREIERISRGTTKN